MTAVDSMHFVNHISKLQQNAGAPPLPDDESLSNVLLLQCFHPTIKKTPNDRIRGAYRAFKEEISGIEWTTARELIQHLNEEIKVFRYYNSSNRLCMNVYRRVLKIIKEEYYSLMPQEILGKERFYINSSELNEDDPTMYSVESPKLKETIETAIDEVLSELKNSDETIAELASTVIEHGDIIMVMGYDKMLLGMFQRLAAKNIKFEVVVALGTNLVGVQHLTQELDAISIPCSAISNHQIHIAMEKTNKVLIAPELISSENGVLAPFGSLMLALSAKELQVPLICCAGISRLQDKEDQIKDLEAKFEKNAENAYDPNPEFDISIFDYIPLNFVSAFLFNTGQVPAKFLHTAIKETYYLEEEFKQ